jgi:hypothetical protein
MDNTPRRVSGDATDATGRVTENAPADGSDDNVNVDERTRDIRNEIEETRVEMSETIDAIQEKLKPRNLVASATDRVRNAATERVRDMADTASQTAQQAVDYTRDMASSVTDRARRNPIPFALIGVGAAWLLSNRSQRRSYRNVERGRGDYGRQYGSRTDEQEYGEWRDREADHGLIARIRNNPMPAALAGVGLGWLAFSSNEPRARQYAAGWRSQPEGSPISAEGGTGERAMTQKLTDSAGEIATRTREYASDAADTVRRMARTRQNQLQRMVQENPLLVGAGALLLGAAFGLAVPKTEAEDELMGETRDNMVDRARDMARDVASQVQSAAGTVADAAGEVARKSQP